MKKHVVLSTRLAPIRMFVVASVCLTVMAIVPSQIQACVCGRIPTPAEELKHSDVVFRGVPKSFDSDRQVYRFEVAEVWKGQIGTSTEVQPGFGTCGLGFELNVEYLVYLTYGRNGTLESYTCGRTNLTESAATDLLVLGPGREPGDFSYPVGGGGGLAESAAAISPTIGALAVAAAIGMLALFAIGLAMLQRMWR